MNRTMTALIQAAMVVVCTLSVVGAVNWDRGIVWAVLSCNAVALILKAIDTKEDDR